MLSQRWNPPVVADDHHSLETDVMRFMAILGFCLMAVFALIQAIPVSQQTGGVGLLSHELLQRQIQSLQTQLQELSRQSQSLRVQAKRQQHQLAQLVRTNSLLSARLAQAETMTESVVQRLEQSQRSSKRLLAQLQQDAQALATTEKELAKLQRLAQRDQAKLASLDQNLKSMQVQLEALAQPAQPVAPPRDLEPTQGAKQVPVPEPEVLPEVLPAKPIARQSAEAGVVANPSKAAPLTMRFRSTAALERLIAGNRTVLYGIAGSRAWRSQPDGAFAAAPKPSRPYRLTENPGQRLQQQFRRGSGLLGANAVQWWVTLDQPLVKRISQLLEQHHSGQLVIQGNGSIVHEAAEANAGARQ